MEENKTKYTPSEALRFVAGLHRKRLYEMMKDGEISYESDNGKRSIDGAELARVFGEKFYPQGILETSEGNIEKHGETERNITEILRLHHEISLLREQNRSQEALLHEKERMIENISIERNEWREQAKKHTLLLTESRSKEKHTFWTWLLGKSV